MALLLEINPYNPQHRLINQVVEVLKKGGVVCYPTDTMYGLGCDIFNQKAVKRIFQIKQRPKNKPFSFMCSDLKNISEYSHVGNMAYRMMRKCLPGPYTFVLSGTKLVPKIMLTKQKTVGIRVPDHPISLALIQGLGNPILTTTAILDRDKDPPVDGYDVNDIFNNQVDLVIDGGPIVPRPSSVVSLIDDIPDILRVGKGDVSLFQ